jgi:hypothetical protein
MRESGEAGEGGETEEMEEVEEMRKCKPSLPEADTAACGGNGSSRKRRRRYVISGGSLRYRIQLDEASPYRVRHASNSKAGVTRNKALYQEFFVDVTKDIGNRRFPISSEKSDESHYPAIHP